MRELSFEEVLDLPFGTLVMHYSEHGFSGMVEARINHTDEAKRRLSNGKRVGKIVVHSSLEDISDKREVSWGNIWEDSDSTGVFLVENHKAVSSETENTLKNLGKGSVRELSHEEFSELPTGYRVLIRNEDGKLVDAMIIDRNTEEGVLGLVNTTLPYWLEFAKLQRHKRISVRSGEERTYVYVMEGK